MNQLSIRRILIRRTLMALTVIGVVGSVAAYALGYQYANLAYDRALLDDVETLADQISLRQGKLEVNLPPAAQKWLLADEGEKVIWQIIDLSDGTTIAGNGQLAGWQIDEGLSVDPHYRNSSIGDTRYRVAYIRKTIDPTDHPVLIEIGETLGKRIHMASNILFATLAVIMTMVLLAAVLIWRGVVSALKPLRELEREAEKRSSSNLTPLQPSLAPEEVRGLIHSINNMMERLTRSIEAQRRFTSNAAHQLRTPIAGLKLQAQIVLKGPLDVATRQHIDEIEREAARAAHLIEQLLILSKAESDETMLVRTPVDMAKVSLFIIERYLSQAAAKGIDLGYEGPAEGAVVDGNDALLSEMLSNLVDNAIRYTQAHGKITVSTEIAAHQVKVSVSDNGPGVAEAEHDKLFMRLYRSDSSQQLKGAGLGLAIVKEIANRYGANVIIDSSVGAGSTFTIDLPKFDNSFRDKE